MAENIRVICRVRPLNSMELGKNNEFGLKFPSANVVTSGNKTFTFDGVLQPKTTQKEAFDIIGKPVVDNVLNGFNGTIFAYGQTASGKTHTMQGKMNDENLKGLVPRIVEEIFEHIGKMDENLSFLIKISYLEIYLERIKDLFDTTKDNLPVGEDQNRVPYVKGATEKYVATADEIYDALEEGKNNRKVAFTNMNADSSRSHSIFSMMVTQENTVSKKQMHGKLYLIDLAGSEKVSKTGAEGTVLDEAKNINKSLSALGNVINALVEGIAHIPYRDSKLTRILQESLGGNSKTTMVICVSPAPFNEVETRSTLLFGQRAKTIKNKVQCNMELSAEEWKNMYNKLQARYNSLISAFRKMEAEVKRWRAGEKVPPGEQFKEDQYAKLLKPEGEGETAGTGSLGRTESATGAAKLPPRPGAGGGAGGGAAAAPDSVRALYAELDNKDEEIAKLSQEILKQKNEITSLHADLKKARLDRDSNTAVSSKVQAEIEAKKKEVKEVLQALEELALNFDQKSTDLENKKKELEKTQEALQKSQLEAKTKTADSASFKDGLFKQKIQFIDAIFSMFDDLGQIGAAIGDSVGKINIKKSDKLEDQISNMKVYISKIKAEANNFVGKGRAGAIGKEKEPLKKIEMLENELQDVRKNCDDRLTTLLAEKKKVEMENNQLKRDNGKLRTDEKIAVAAKDIKDNKPDVYEKLQNSIKATIDKYISDVNEYRFQMNEKGKEIQDLKNKLDAANAEIGLMKKSGFGFDSDKQNDKREQARTELKGLEDNVTRELQTLHNLRKMFIGDLKNRIKKASQKQSVQQILEDDEDEFAGSEKLTPQQKEKINFLENNLENLTKVHKQLVRDNADLRCELPKMEKRLKATMERVKQLEGALKEAKENANRERKRLTNEVDRLKEASRRKGATAAPSIARPIKAGGTKAA